MSITLLLNTVGGITPGLKGLEKTHEWFVDNRANIEKSAVFLKSWRNHG